MTLGLDDFFCQRDMPATLGANLNLNTLIRWYLPMAAVTTAMVGEQLDINSYMYTLKQIHVL